MTAKEVRVSDPIYRTKLMVLVEPSNKRVDKILDGYKYTGPRVHADNEGVAFRLTAKNSIANFTLIRLRSRSVPVLCHELIHHGMFTLSEKDISLSTTEDEALCYFVEYCMREVLRKWGKK